MKQLFLFRHVESLDNAADVFSGSRDFGISEHGKSQIQSLKNQLSKQDITLVISSPYKRCMETVNGIFNTNEIDILTDSRIRERAYGALQGLHHDRLPLHLKLLKALSYRSYLIPPPGGESFRTVWKRVNEFIIDLPKLIETTPGNVAICAHHNSMRPIRQHFEHLSIAQALAMDSPHGAVYIYQIKEQK